MSVWEILQKCDDWNIDKNAPIKICLNGEELDILAISGGEKELIIDVEEK